MQHPTIAIVTPTYNRAALLERLATSLESQSDQNFTWVVVDDGSDDETWEVLERCRHAYGRRLTAIRRRENGGKAAALNQAFDQVTANAVAVVDSDDWLLPHAIAVMKKEVSQFYDDPSVGALFFDYKDTSGNSIRGKHQPESLVMTRSKHSEVYGKYDGCVVYFDRTLRAIQYPVFEGEKYVGPTVLQLLMWPQCIAFIAKTIGIAEYQPHGLTRQGRALRLKSPLGMMTYTALLHQQATRRTDRLKQAVMFRVYLRFASPEGRRKWMTKRISEFPRTGLVSTMIAWILSTYWARKYKIAVGRLGKR